MSRCLILFVVVTVPLLFAGCKTEKDLLSWSPFWWVINLRKVEHPGGVRGQSQVVAIRNYYDGKKVYSYKIESGSIYIRIEGEHGDAWRLLPGGNPHDCDGTALKAIRLAADNNRIFILAQNAAGKRSLWWYCVKHDEAIWSSILIHAGGDFTKRGYAKWYECAHTRDTVWVNLLALRSFVPYIEPRMEMVRGEDGTNGYRVVPFNAPRMSIEVDDVVDIAVGCWRGTVVTYYVLMGSTGKIMYIDEEIIMDRWKEVPNIHGAAKNSPYPLDSTARIAASNSVVAVYHQKNDSAFVTWIRWDFHNRQDFEYFPLNWCETDWRTVPCPLLHADHFFLDTHWPDEVHDTIWNVPPGITRQFDLVKSILPDEVGKKMTRDDWKGCLASYNTADISRYYLAFDVVKGDSTSILREENEKYPGISGMAWNIRTGEKSNSTLPQEDTLDH